MKFLFSILMLFAMVSMCEKDQPPEQEDTCQCYEWVDDGEGSGEQVPVECDCEDVPVE